MEDNKEKIELIKKSFEFKSLKKYKEAIEALYKALEYDDVTQDNIELMSQIGELYILLENYPRALDEFNKILSLDKNHKTSHQRCFDLYYMMGQYNKALNLAQKMCENDKNSINYHNYLKVLPKELFIKLALFPTKAGKSEGFFQTFSALGVLHLAKKVPLKDFKQDNNCPCLE